MSQGCGQNQMRTECESLLICKAEYLMLSFVSSRLFQDSVFEKWDCKWYYAIGS